MKTYSEPALEAFAAGTLLSVGAVNIVCSPSPVRVWGGFGTITLAGDDYAGIGDAGLVSVTAKSLGGTEQAINLALSGVDPATLALFDAGSLRRVPVVIWRLIFNPSGQSLLDAQEFGQGRLDQVVVQETPGGTATITATVDGAARGLGRAGGRMRSDADQRLISATDGAFKHVSYAGQKTLYWGGKPPATAAQALPASVLVNNALTSSLKSFTG